MNKLHIEILYLWVNIVILLDSKNEIKIFGVTAPLMTIKIIIITLFIKDIIAGLRYLK